MSGDTELYNTAFFSFLQQKHPQAQKQGWRRLQTFKGGKEKFL